MKTSLDPDPPPNLSLNEITTMLPAEEIVDLSRLQFAAPVPTGQISQ
jgi:hypothetical protein